ncbi:SurA N-terminal domain-containing protein [Marinomonas pollencensis]|uniref:Periplasmic chaperone PpiD n=1 Tax=Marinomonas pollencensis TaxID=491954 RepID=A0A3E0DSN7_9GAMM|nr:SurA N-terminal domain-containing protein [Marinomonas pollencensis]REG86490.1 peptidyl-prolyl cis-trans isomerase D [Marinomonas pollencensis]
MLQDIRDKSQGIVVKIIVGFIVVTFALFGVDALVQSFNSSDKVAEVDGTDITRTQMLQGAETQRRQLISMMGGNVDPALLQENVLQSRAINELIQRALLSNQASALDLGVSDAQVNAYLLQAGQFQTDGKFDQTKYISFINSLGYTPLAFKNRIKEDILIQQTRNAIAGSEFVLPYQVNSIAQLQSQQRSYDYVTFSLADESENTNVSDQELKAYYDAHQEDFKTPEEVKVDYVVLKSSDFKDKVKVTDAELQDAYKAFASGAAQEERDASHILIDTSSRTADEAQQRLAEVKAKLAAGEKFADLAEQYSDDIGSKNAGGELGYIAKGSMVAPFEDTLFGMKKGEVKSVETKFGLHLIKLNAISEAKVASFAEKKAELTNNIMAAKTRDALLGARENITDLAYASDQLDALAKEYGVKVQTSDYFSRQGGSDVLTSNPAVISAAFGDTVLKDNQNSDLIDISDDEVVVIHLNDHQEEAVQSFADAKAEVTSHVVQEKAVASLKAKAEAAKTATGTQWKAVAQAERGQDEVTSLAFTMPYPNEQPVIEVKTLSNGDLALIRLNKVAPGSEQVTDSQKQAYESYLNQTEATMSTQAQQKFLEDSADIERTAL